MPAVTARALNVRQYGKGPNTVVLAHGFGANQSVWQPYVEELAAHNRVVTYDLACAYSADPAFFNMGRHRDLDGYVEDLLNVLRHAGVETCQFVGHSVSGMIGLLASQEKPRTFDKIITIGSSACYLNLDGYEGGLSRDDVRHLLSAIAANYRSWAESYAPYVVGRPPNDHATETFLDCLLAMRSDVSLATAQMILYADYRAAMAKVPVPTIILQTKNDPAVPLPAAQFMRDHIADSHLEIVDATGHMPHMTAVDLMRGVLRRHLAGSPGPAEVA
jgi:sigma-B regulation protein RsbQ